MTVCLGLCLVDKSDMMGVGTKNCATPPQQPLIQTLIFKKARNG